LVERHGVLGTSYDANSQLSLGANRSTSFGLSLGYRIDANNSVLVESGFAVTGASQGNGLLTGTTTIQSRSVGLSFLSRHFLHRDDQLAVSLKQPLRVVSGSVGVITPSIDAAGVAHYSAESVSLVPTGRELDFKLAYDAQLRKNQTLSLQLTARKDVTNYAGSQDASVGAIWNSKF
jgi:hypothetical protein